MNKLNEGEMKLLFWDKYVPLFMLMLLNNFFVLSGLWFGVQINNIVIEIIIYLLSFLMYAIGCYTFFVTHASAATVVSLSKINSIKEGIYLSEAKSNYSGLINKESKIKLMRFRLNNQRN